MTYANSLPRREAGSLINRTVTVRTIADFRHPRTDSAALLLLSTTTELFIVDLVAQHDPQPDSQLACHRHTRLPYKFTTFYNRLRSFDTFDFREFIFMWHVRNVIEVADILI